MPRGSRVQYLGRHIMVKGRFADMILEGRKTTTIRLGVVRPKYREVIIHGHGRPLAKAEITDVRVKKVSELTREDVTRDGFRSLRELVDALERIYGTRVGPETLVTVIGLRVVKRLDQLDSQDPYMGLEPADIARLALRYLRGSLSDGEITVLEDLTRTNSIRTTSIRLYGSLEKRWKVRRVIRKALRRLMAQGFIKPGKRD